MNDKLCDLYIFLWIYSLKVCDLYLFCSELIKDID